MKEKELRNFYRLVTVFLTIQFSMISTLAAQEAFKFDVFINNAENPSLIFGADTQKKEEPAPPYSGMFGVIDISFLNVENKKPEKWFDRLSTDIKPAENASRNGWVIFAKNDAILKFQKQSGTIPPDLQISYKKNPFSATEDLTIENLDDQKELYVKTGGYYFIHWKNEAENLTPPPADDVVFIPDTEDSHANPPSKEVALEENTLEIIININAGTNIVKLFGKEDSKTADWEIKLVRNGMEIADFKWLIDNAKLKVIFKASSKRADGTGTMNIAMIPKKNSAQPVQTDILTSSEELVTQTPITWIAQPPAITLDIDNNGIIDKNDARFFLNYISKKKPGKPLPGSFGTRDMLNFTEKGTTDQDAQNALGWLNINYEVLNIDDSNDGVNKNDARFFLNFISKKKPGKPLPGSFGTRDMLNFTEKGTVEKDANQALTKLNSLVK